MANQRSGLRETVRLGAEITTDQITAAWEDDDLYVNDYITQANFPLAYHRPEYVEIEVIDPGCSFTEEEGLKFLEAAGLQRPTEEHALRFSDQFGRVTMPSGRKPFILFLHRPWQDPSGRPRQLAVIRIPGDRKLDLMFSDFRFDVRYVLAGVRRK